MEQGNGILPPPLLGQGSPPGAQGHRALATPCTHTPHHGTPEVKCYGEVHFVTENYGKVPERSPLFGSPSRLKKCANAGGTDILLGASACLPSSLCHPSATAVL